MEALIYYLIGVLIAPHLLALVFAYKNDHGDFPESLSLTLMLSVFAAAALFSWATIITLLVFYHKEMWSQICKLTFPLNKNNTHHDI